jgi:hypothetical protein
LANLDGAPGCRFALGKSSARVGQATQVVIDGGDFRMFFAQVLDGQAERAAVELFGAVKLPRIFVEHRVIVQHCHQRERVFPQLRRKALFGQRQSLLEERFGLRVAALLAELPGALAEQVDQLFRISVDCLHGGAHLFAPCVSKLP